MVITTGTGLVEVLQQVGVLDDSQAEELRRDRRLAALEARALAGELVRRGWLTPYQANQVLPGRAADLVLGQYLLLERLGQGGMGQVFKARHLLLGRIVALKVIRKDRLNNPDAVRRFRREIRAAAQLSHPNVILAFDAEEAGGTHFLAMEYVEGTDLAKLLKERGALPVREACDYVRQAALGLQHAYERGLVHRDVKPSNLLLSGKPDTPLANRTIKVLDLGLARVADPLRHDESSHTLTAEGAVMGTPDYIAPEQIEESREVDIRVDIYSLGCTLYHLLTGRPPFPGGSLGRKLSRHLTAEPAAVESLRLDLPPGLPIVVRQMMAKRPEDRHQTPADVARALTAFTEGPAETVPPPVPVPVRQVPPLAPSTLLAPPDTPFNELNQETTSESADSPRRRQHQIQQLRMLLFSAMGLLVLLCMVALLTPLIGTNNSNRTPERGGEKVRSPLDALSKDSIPVAERFDWQPPELVALLGRHGLRHPGSTSFVNAVCFSPDGQLVASGGEGVVRLWEAATGRERQELHCTGAPTRILALAFSRSGRWLAMGASDTTVRLWERTEKGYKEVDVLGGHSKAVQSVAFTPDEKFLASGGADQKVLVFDINRSPPVPVQTLTGHADQVTSVVFSVDGKTLVTAGNDKTVRLWGREGNDWKEQAIFTLTGTDAQAASAALSPDSQILAAGGADGWVRLWSLDGKPDKPRSEFRAHKGIVSAVAFSPDGRELLTSGHDGQVRIWDELQEKKPAERASLTGHFARVNAAAYAPDGKSLVTGSADGTVRIWDRTADGWRERFPLRGHVGPVRALAFAPDGRALLTGNDMTVLYWRLAGDAWEEPRRVGEVVSPARAVFFLPERARMVAVLNARATLWDTACESFVEPVCSLWPPGTNILAASCPRDGQFLAAGCADKTILVWDLAEPNLKDPLVLPGHKSPVEAVAVSPDGKILASGDGNGELRLWHRPRDQWKERGSIVAHKGKIAALAYTPDGKMLLSAGVDGTLRLWEPDQLKQMATPLEVHDSVVGLALAPDGKTAATIGTDHRLVWWEVGSWKKLGERELPFQPVGIAFAPDGRHLALGNDNGTVYILRLRTY
jgi:WD40 repeat protein/serine/threonine protein kinase